MSNSHHDMTTDELWEALNEAEGFERGHIFYTLALRHRSEEDWGQVIIFAEQSAEIMRALGSTREEGYAYELVGQALDGQHDHEAAITEFMKAASLFHEINLDEGLGSVYAYAGYAARHKRDHVRSAEYFALSETFYRQCTNEFEAVAGATRDLGLSLGRIPGREHEALEALLRALDAAQGSSELHFIYELHDYLINAYARVDNRTMALHHAETALRLGKTCPCNVCMPTATYRLGVVYRELGSPKSKKFIDDAYEIAKTNGNASLQAKCLVEFGRITMDDDLDQASEYFKDALVVVESTGFTGAIATCKRELGRVAQRQGNLNQALAYLREAIDAFSDDPDKCDIAVIEQSIAEVLMQQGEFNAAVAVLENNRWWSDTAPIHGVMVGNHMALYARALLAAGRPADALQRADQLLTQLASQPWHAIVAPAHEVRARALQHKDPIASDRAAVQALAHYTLANMHTEARTMASEFFVEPYRVLSHVATDHDARQPESMA